ncbi:MAG TPA: GFA family protein [Pseudomonadales bacterium]
MTSGTPFPAPAAGGRCLCGRYRFHTRGNPLWVAHCHCESCRRHTGAPVATYAGYLQEAVGFEPETPPFFNSSAGVRRSFCERCSTPLAYAAEFFPGEIHLFRSTFDEPAALEVTRHVLFNEREADFDVHDDLPRYGTVPGQIIGWGPRPALRVLFLCTGNSARSILAEAMLNLRGARIGAKRVRAHSAGSTPLGEVNPAALTLLEPYRHRLDQPRSKSWDEFSSVGAPPLDWVITLCDSAATEACPIFPGGAEKRHWSLPDPATGAATFEDTWRSLDARLTAFLEELSARGPGRS